jgi:hypothetical protein
MGKLPTSFKLPSEYFTFENLLSDKMPIMIIILASECLKMLLKLTKMRLLGVAHNAPPANYS